MEKIKLFNNEKRIKLRKNETWEVQIVDKTILFEYLVNFLLDKVNLFYYASQKSSTITIQNTKKYIEKLIELNILDQEIDSVLNSIGWDKEKINVTNTVFQGDLAEYLMCILLDELIDVSTIISKVSLKTSPNVPSFGNDNIFYNYNNKILYFGEAKFYSDINTAIDRAYSSLNEHNEIVEISFIKSHTNIIIAPSGEKRDEVIELLETVPSDNLTIQSIIFIISDDYYEKLSIEKLLKIKLDKKDPTENEKILFVFLPILSKQEFLLFFKESLV